MLVYIGMVVVFCMYLLIVWIIKCIKKSKISKLPKSLIPRQQVLKKIQCSHCPPFKCIKSFVFNNKEFVFGITQYKIYRILFSKKYKIQKFVQVFKDYDNVIQTFIISMDGKYVFVFLRDINIVSINSLNFRIQFTLEYDFKIQFTSEYEVMNLSPMDIVGFNKNQKSINVIDFTHINSITQHLITLDFHCRTVHKLSNGNVAIGGSSVVIYDFYKDKYTRMVYLFYISCHTLNSIFVNSIEYLVGCSHFCYCMWDLNGCLKKTITLPKESNKMFKLSDEHWFSESFNTLVYRDVDIWKFSLKEYREDDIFFKNRRQFYLMKKSPILICRIKPQTIDVIKINTKLYNPPKLTDWIGKDRQERMEFALEHCELVCLL